MFIKIESKANKRGNFQYVRISQKYESSSGGAGSEGKSLIIFVFVLRLLKAIFSNSRYTRNTFWRKKIELTFFCYFVMENCA